MAKTQKQVIKQEFMANLPHLWYKNRALGVFSIGQKCPIFAPENKTKNAACGTTINPIKKIF
ncbi:MAG: hypothetical protein J6W69_02125 [Bacteroidales bacterium]|nr:hypothetical protein [Bacteroidales bacterium]